jgi:hypothetical protein
MSKKNKKHIEDFYTLAIENFKLETELVKDGPYKGRPIVIVYPYSIEEIGHPGYNQNRIDVSCFNDLYWFNYLNFTMTVELNLEASQYALFKALKEIMKRTGIQKELLPEKRYKETFPPHTQN